MKPDTYFDQLPVVMKEVPPLPGEEALYEWITSVWDAAAKNPETKKALIASFAAADAELVQPLFQFQYNGRSVGNGWNVPGQCLGVGDRLPEPHRHQQVEHVSEHVGGELSTICENSTATANPSTENLNTPSPLRRDKSPR